MDCCTGIGFEVYSDSNDHVDDEEKEARGDEARDGCSGDVEVAGVPSDIRRVMTSCCEESSMYFCIASC